MPSKQTILLSNDDGIHAPGIHILAKALAEVAQVVIIAPHRERSAHSHFLTVSDPLRVEKLSPLPYASDIYEVSGTPVDCVKLGLDSILSKKPDWIFSGINRGGNLGTDVLYSGTVAAAMEGAIQGYKAMAFSSHGPGKGDSELHYETAASLAKTLFENQAKIDLPIHKMINVNVPAIPLDKLKGVRSAFLGRRIYKDTYAKKTDPRGIPYYWLGADAHGYESEAGSDCDTVAEGWASMTMLQPSLEFDQAQKTFQNTVQEIFPS